MERAEFTSTRRKGSWVWAALALAGGFLLYSRAKRSQMGTPNESEPMPRDRALDRERNIEYLKQHYPEREYKPSASAAPQPDPEQKPVKKDEAPLHGFHGG